jgi:polyisoprenoid-binding protein YceI
MATWFFEPGHTAAMFRARHMMVTYVRGHFKNVGGSLVFDPENPAQSSADVAIDAAAIWTGQPQRDAHLRSADFLDVENHSRMINRHLFGVNWNDVVDKGGVVVGNTIDITIDAEAILEGQNDGAREATLDAGA